MNQNLEQLDMKTARLGVSGLLVRGGRSAIGDMSILLGLRDRNDTSLPGLWCTPGGGVEEGEALDIALIREFKEETNLTIDVGRTISVQERTSARGNIILVFKQVFLRTPDPARALDGFEQLAMFDESQLREMFAKKQVTDMTEAAIREFWRYCR
jgi:8-oxo-dGTP pyrophosphatase MutT (NUDIX family)